MYNNIYMYLLVYDICIFIYKSPKIVVLCDNIAFVLGVLFGK